MNNICYVNSVMQCLYSCRLFRKQILSLKQITDENSMLKAINDLFIMIETKKKKTGVIDSKKFILSVKKNNQEFNNEEHHDSHEFLIWLLDTLKENIKGENKKIKGTNYNSVLFIIILYFYFRHL
jgi:ubiquitin C-terminal hydrolase